MNRFRFRFRSVLRFREAREEEKKQEFGIKLTRLKHEEDELGGIVNTSKNHDMLMEKSGHGRTSVRTLMYNYFYARFLDKSISDQQNAVVSAEDDVEAKRIELTEATKKKKILERLKERELEDYNRAIVKEEQTLIDEIATQRFDRDVE